MCIVLSDFLAGKYETLCAILVPFVQFKTREKHPWRSDTFSKVCRLKPLPYGRFSCFLSCKNGSKSRKASHIAKRLARFIIKLVTPIHMHVNFYVNLAAKTVLV